MLPISPKPCRNCGQLPLPGAPYCTNCGTLQFVAAPAATGLSCLFVPLGAAAAPVLLYVLFRCAVGLLPFDAVPWQPLLTLGLLLCGLVGGVGLLPRFSGPVRGLSLGLILGGFCSAVLAACCAVLLGGLAACLKGIRDI